MPGETDIADLILKFLRNELSEKEMEELAAWLHRSPENQKFLETFLTKERVMEALKVFDEIDKERIWEKLMKLIK